MFVGGVVVLFARRVFFWSGVYGVVVLMLPSVTTTSRWHWSSSQQANRGPGVGIFMLAGLSKVVVMYALLKWEGIQ